MTRLLGFLSLLALIWPASSPAEEMGRLSIFRWNVGYRAESQPVVEKAMTQAEFQALVREQQLPRDEALFRGCYLAHFQAPAKRAPASVGVPKSELRRICVAGNQ